MHLESDWLNYPGAKELEWCEGGLKYSLWVTLAIISSGSSHGTMMG